MSISFNNKSLKTEEEKEEFKTLSVPDEIYDDDFKLVNIPPQSLDLLRNFENKIKKNCETFDICIEVSRNSRKLKLFLTILSAVLFYKLNFSLSNRLSLSMIDIY